MNEVKITYETLFDLLRREKDREELQQLDDTFYNDVMDYLVQKYSMIKQDANQAALFGGSESEKIKVQIQNIKKIIKELYERRLSKIIRLSVNKSRLGRDLSNTIPMLPEEKKVFDELVGLFVHDRKEVLNDLLFFGNGDAKPSQMDLAKQSPKSLKSVENKEQTSDSKGYESQDSEDISSDSNESDVNDEVDVQAGENNTNNFDNSDENIESEKSVDEPKKDNSKDEPVDEHVAKPGDNYDNKVKVKFTSPVPKFVGKKMEVYGPYQEGDEAELPEMIANILINKSRAEKINEIEV